MSTRRRVIVTGSRGWNDRHLISETLADLALEFGPANLTIVHGNARGADRLAKQEAEKHGLLLDPHPADWEGFTRQDYLVYGYKGAGRKRNQHMADLGADLCVAFWDGVSGGTKDMMQRATRAGIPVRVVRKNGVVEALG